MERNRDIYLKLYDVKESERQTKEKEIRALKRELNGLLKKNEKLQHSKERAIKKKKAEKEAKLQEEIEGLTIKIKSMEQDLAILRENCRNICSSQSLLQAVGKALSIAVEHEKDEISDKRLHAALILERRLKT